MDTEEDNHNTSDVSRIFGSLPGLFSGAVYWQLLHIVVDLVTAVGVFATGANLVTITVYYRMGFADSTNISLTALALSDLGIALTTISSALGLLLPTIPDAKFTHEIFLTTSVHPHTLLSRISAMITTYLSIERYLCVLLPLKIKTIITPRRTLIVIVAIYGATFGLYPVLVIGYPIGWKFYPERNASLLGVVPNLHPTVVMLDNIVLFVVSTFLPCVTFFSVIVFTLLLSLTLQRSKAWRDANKYNSSNTQSADETGSKLTAKQSKEDRAVRMVLTIATVFIVTNIPSCIHMVAMAAVPGFSVTGRYSKLFLLMGVLYLGVDSVNSGANVIIYYRMSNKFRHAMISLFSSKTDQPRNSRRVKFSSKSQRDQE